MTGTVFSKTLPSGKTYLYINLSYKDPRDEKWKTKTVSTGLTEAGNKKKAKKLVDEYVEKYSYLEKAPTIQEVKLDMEITLCDYLDFWLNRKRIELEEPTYESYQYRTKAITTYWKSHGNPKLREVTPHMLDNYFKYELQYGKINQKTKEKGPLTVRTVRSRKSILISAYGQAIIDGLIEINPASAVKVSGKSNKDYEEQMLFLTEDEIKDVLSFLASPENKPFRRLIPMVFICTYMGLRRSELLGLKWTALNFTKNTMEICHTAVRVKTVKRENHTKTINSLRVLTLFPTAVQCLQKVKRKQEENEAFYGEEYFKSPYVFTWEDGHLYDPNYISKLFKKAMVKYGRPEITLHKLRHTCASLLIDKGWDVKKLQYWLGHSDVSTTLNIYAHFNKQRLNEMPDDLEDLSKDAQYLFS